MFYCTVTFLLELTTAFVAVKCKSLIFYLLLFVFALTCVLNVFTAHTKFSKIFYSFSTGIYAGILIYSLYMHTLYGSYIADYKLAALQMLFMVVLGAAYIAKEPDKV